MGTTLSKVPAALSVLASKPGCEFAFEKSASAPARDSHKSKRPVCAAESTRRAAGTAPPSEFCMGTKRAFSWDGRLEELMGRFHLVLI